MILQQPAGHQRTLGKGQMTVSQKCIICSIFLGCFCNGLLGSASSEDRLLRYLISTPADKICPVGFIRLLKSRPACGSRAFERSQRMSPSADIFGEELRSDGINKRGYLRSEMFAPALDIHGLGMLRGLRSEYKISQSFAPSEDIFGMGLLRAF
jgi:hypothetical protein